MESEEKKNVPGSWIRRFSLFESSFDDMSSKQLPCDLRCRATSRCHSVSCVTVIPVSYHVYRYDSCHSRTGKEFHLACSVPKYRISS